MLRRIWQSAMIKLATSPRLTNFMQGHRATSVLAAKYTGGQSATDGVRRAKALELAQRGERIRFYVPFGKDWWPYGVRRIGENPANAVLLGRSLFS